MESTIISLLNLLCYKRCGSAIITYDSKHTIFLLFFALIPYKKFPKFPKFLRASDVSQNTHVSSFFLPSKLFVCFVFRTVAAIQYAIITLLVAVYFQYQHFKCHHLCHYKFINLTIIKVASCLTIHWNFQQNDIKLPIPIGPSRVIL